jgi:hypothetical protein
LQHPFVRRQARDEDELYAIFGEEFVERLGVVDRIDGVIADGVAPPEEPLYGVFRSPPDMLFGA